MDATQLLSQLVAAGLVTESIEMLKKTRVVTVVNENTPKNNRVAGMLGAIISAFSLHFASDWSGNTLNLHLDAAGFLHATWDTCISWVFQQFIYRMAVEKKPAPTQEMTVNVDQSKTTVNKL